MSKAKDKRIRKFNRKRIWPSVVGMFVLSFLMTFIFFAIISIYLVDIIQKKMSDAYVTSSNIAEYIMQDSHYSYENTNNIKYKLDLFEDVEDLAVLDEATNSFIYKGDKIPDLNNKLTFYDPTEMYDGTFDIIIEDDHNDIFMSDEQTAQIDEYLFVKLNHIKVIVDIGEEALTDIHIIDSNIWYIYNYDGYKVFLLNNIFITQSEMNMILVTLVLYIFLVVVFLLYHIVSVISVARNQKRITKLLYTDMVTGGYNWLHFTKKGDKLLRKNRGKLNYAVVNLRMEKYRSFCTCFGVKEGEELMEKFYNALKKKFSKKELMAHHDEADFGLLISYKSKEELLSRIQNIENTLCSQVPSVKIYFRFGLCLADANDREIDSLYNNSTTALELLSDDSDDKIVSYDIEMKKQQLWERKVEDEMDKALVTKQFKLYLQPKYSAKEEILAGAEALVRWIHPVEGLIPPNKFIPIFEKNGFILQLDDYMLEEVAAQQARWLSEGKELFPISVNVSRAHFTREDLAEHICKIVDKYNVPHKYIELELTESAFFDDKYVLIDTVNQLRQYGFIVSMDDFGAGYSSLNSLKELTIDVLKIDADFFRGIDSVDRGMLIVAEVIDLAKKLDMKIVAEGIENKEQVEFLTAQECDLIQGYYFAKPMSIEEFEEKYS